MASKHIGNRYGTRTVLDSELHKSEAGNYMQRFLVRCDCGDEKWVGANVVMKAGGSVCRICKRVADAERSAAGYKHPLYGTWWAMISRCYDPNSRNFPSYGGRGITVHDKWRGDRPEGEMGTMDGFHAFVRDMGEKPVGASIDRVDNDGPYSPENCRWATQEVQANNTRANVRVSVDGTTYTIAQWGRVLGVGVAWAQQARKYGAPLDVAVRKLLEIREGGWADWQGMFGVAPKPRQGRLTAYTTVMHEYDAWLKNMESSFSDL